MGDALRELPIADLLFDERGDLRRLVNVYVDGTDIRAGDGVGTPLVGGESIRVVQAVAGGAVVAYVWRGDFTNGELNALHAEAFNHPVLMDDWRHQVQEHSLGWVCAREDTELVGFVNVPWDGGVHAFVLDTIVARRARRRGVGRQLVAVAREETRSAGCEWLHVDFDDELRSFYFDACGFAPTNAGLIALR